MEQGRLKIVALGRGSEGIQQECKVLRVGMGMLYTSTSGLISNGSVEHQKRLKFPDWMILSLEVSSIDWQLKVLQLPSAVNSGRGQAETYREWKNLAIAWTVWERRWTILCWSGCVQNRADTARHHGSRRETLAPSSLVQMVSTGSNCSKGGGGAPWPDQWPSEEKSGGLKYVW